MAVDECLPSEGLINSKASLTRQSTLSWVGYVVFGLVHKLQVGQVRLVELGQVWFGLAVVGGPW